MKPINVALCSFGMSGYVFHAPFAAKNPNLNLYAVWERTKNEAVKKYPDIITFRTLDELLADNKVELVIVNTPSVTHYEYAKKALEAFKHVIVEKPFVASTEQANELIALAKKNDLKLSVFHNRRYDSDFKTVQKVLENNSLGQLVEAHIHYDRYHPGLSPKAHKEVDTPAVGGLYDLGSHLIDQALHLFGKPNAVFADLEVFRPGAKVVDYFDVRLFYDTFRVTLKSSLFVKEVTTGFTLHGTKGSFVKSRADVQEAALQRGEIPGGEGYGIEPENEMGLLHAEIDGNENRIKAPTLAGNYMQYFDGVVDAIRNDKTLPVTGEEATLVIEVIEACLASNKEKRVIAL
ncbi:Gfo/Idh/MocA family oxidoreductase [Maribacter sp. MAR_2009_72]|uniref:Gfo/Idh/MocA family oxidoreductase n=1 Tax=Maribacter sp. MAR_2009_72 TaxID=1250050 RepID=UPI00119BC066|nr:Gfo/Idh/MocA family oxidoreductase [Maribacter sp. MAR_2009_72]TVZ17083.1 putative dehydrogenase [Maribacter sp. MAR_2009_72]